MLNLGLAIQNKRIIEVIFLSFNPAKGKFNTILWGHDIITFSVPIRPVVWCFATHPFARQDPEGWAYKLHIVWKAETKNVVQPGSLRDFYHLQPPFLGRHWELPWSVCDLEAIKTQGSASILEVKCFDCLGFLFFFFFPLYGTWKMLPCYSYNFGLDTAHMWLYILKDWKVLLQCKY